METDAKPAVIEEIVDDALGDLARWEKPNVEPSIGPKFPELAEKYYTDIQATKHELRELLKPHSLDWLVSHFQTNNYNGKKVLRDRDGTSFKIVRRIDILRDRKPAWFIAGWHIKELELDVAHWRAFSRCTLIELTIMSVGLDPRKVNYDALFRRYGHLDPQDKMLEFIENQLEAIANGLALDPDNDLADVDLLDFRKWMKKVKFRVDARFRTLLRNKYGSMTDGAADAQLPPSSQKPRPLHKSSYNFHALLLYAVAVEKFGLKDLDDIGRAAKKIQGAAELQGQTPSIRPIKQLLTRGHELRLLDGDR